MADDDKKIEDEDEDGDDKIEVEIEDDDSASETEAEVEAKAKASVESDEDDDEVSQYSERVQKRIKKLTWSQNEERRKREESESIRDRAVEYARAQHNELVRLRQILARGETDLVTTGKSGVEARLASARSALKSANESGDSDAIAKAQEDLALAVAAKTQWENYRPQYQVDQNDPRMQPLPPRRPQPQPQVPTPTPEAQDWAERNPWFNKDQNLTAYAYGLHQEIIEEGVRVDSPEYYRRLDEGMKNVVPSQRPSREAENSRNATVVASSSRNEGKPRSVRLTASQAALVRKLGITPEEYAKEMLKAK